MRFRVIFFFFSCYLLLPYILVLLEFKADSGLGWSAGAVYEYYFHKLGGYKTVEHLGKTERFIFKQYL